jgi:uncharacterized phage-associated protein
MKNPPYDPRAVANLLLDLAADDQDGPGPLTNLVLQKLLYFAHGHYLIRARCPLVTGGFEAWTYGPVHPGVYEAFKTEKARPIQIRAVGRNPVTGETNELRSPDNPQVRRLLKEVLAVYGKLSPGQLVDISHAPRGPWATVVDKSRTSVALGLRISDSVTLECFKHQKIMVGERSQVGEPGEDTPLVA